MSRRAISIMGLVLVVSGVPALGIEGRIPVFAQTTITEPGSYIVTQDFTVASGDAITIAADQVTLDLNGHTITLPTGAGTGVFIGSDYDQITIRNGRIFGGATGVQMYPVPPFVAGRTISVENLVVEASQRGIDLEGVAEAQVISCVVRNTTNVGILISGGSASPSVAGRVVDSIVNGASNLGIYLAGTGCPGIEVEGNSISVQGTSASGILLGCNGARVRDNAVVLPTASSGFTNGIGVHGNHNQVHNNTVQGFATGIFVNQRTGNHVAGNVVRPGAPAGATDGGIVVQGSRTLIEGNQVEGGTGCGLLFPVGSPATGNAYRNNMLRGNTGGAVCGIAQTDAGGNIL